MWDNIFIIELSKKVTGLNWGQDGKLLWLKPPLLWHYKQWSKVRLFELSSGAAPQGLWAAPPSGRGLSEPDNTQACQIWRTSSKQQWWFLSSHPTPQGSALSPLKRCKGMQSDYCTEFKGIFSQVYLEQTPYVWVHASVKMLEQIHKEGCSSLVF